MSVKKLIALAVVLCVLGVLAWSAVRIVRTVGAATVAESPVTRVKRGDVSITVTARGDLQGGNPEVLLAPQVAQDTLYVTFIRNPGELVKPGDIVVELPVGASKPLSICALPAGPVLKRWALLKSSFSRSLSAELTWRHESAILQDMRKSVRLPTKERSSDSRISSFWYINRLAEPRAPPPAKRRLSIKKGNSVGAATRISGSN
jgi:hypothetical protein